MAVRNIRKYKDEILKKRCKEVETVDEKIRTLLNDMAETMYHNNGGGLAACQIGILKRLIVVDMGEGLFKLVNPVIVAEEGQQLEVEGCLSYPGIWGIVKRPLKVTVEALNENGEKIVLHGKGPMAKCLCHEIDHLDGITFTKKVKEFVEV